MSDLSAKLTWYGGLKFTGTNDNGIKTAIDGDRLAGVGPLEMLIEALAACPSTDVVSILAKMREPLTHLEIEIEADRHPNNDPRYLTAVSVRFDLWGEKLSSERVARSINLSFAKYCSVYHSLRPDLALQAAFRIHLPNEGASGEYQQVELTSEAEMLV
jgi:putative redox protein